MKAQDYRNLAWKKLSGDWGTFAIITLIAGLILSAVSVTGIGVILLSGPIALGLAFCFLAKARGQKVEVQSMFNGFSNFVNAFVLEVVNSIFIALWSLLFIVPGIMAELSYSMSFYILQDNPTMSPTDARKKSMELMNGHKWQLFCLRFSFIGWMILGMLTLGILFIWIAPYMQLSEVEFYRHLIGETEANVQAQAKPEQQENASQKANTQSTNQTDADGKQDKNDDDAPKCIEVKPEDIH